MKYTIKEILDIALGIEDIGYEYYKRCHDKFEDQDIKNIFSFLAEEELRHREIFEDMIKKLDINDEGNFSEEYYLYLKTIANEMVFADIADMEKSLAEVKDLTGAIRLALRAEKDSLLWYTELRYNYLDNEEASTVINHLMNEEKKHIITLVDLRDKCSA